MDLWNRLKMQVGKAAEPIAEAAAKAKDKLDDWTEAQEQNQMENEAIEQQIKELDSLKNEYGKRLESCGIKFPQYQQQYDLWEQKPESPTEAMRGLAQAVSDQLQEIRDRRDNDQRLTDMLLSDTGAFQLLDMMLKAAKEGSLTEWSFYHQNLISKLEALEEATLRQPVECGMDAERSFVDYREQFVDAMKSIDENKQYQYRYADMLAFIKGIGTQSVSTRKDLAEWLERVTHDLSKQLNKLPQEVREQLCAMYVSFPNP